MLQHEVKDEAAHARHDGEVHGARSVLLMVYALNCDVVSRGLTLDLPFLHFSA